MSQPTSYTRGYSFTDFAAANPSRPLPGVKVDVELDAVERTLDQTLANLAKLQRDDGALANASVGVQQLAATTLALIGSDTFSVRGAWLTSTAYLRGDFYANANQVYLVMADHTSTSIAADIASSKVVGPVFFPDTAQVAALVTALAQNTGAATIGTSLGSTVEGELTGIRAFIASLLVSTASSGAAIIGAFDFQAGAKWTTVQGYITTILSNLGSSFIGFIQTGTGAVARTVQAKLRDTAGPRDFGVTADGVTDDATKLQATLDAFDHVVASPAQTHATSSALTITRNNVTIEGLKIKPTTSRNLTAVTVGPTSPDASTTLSVNAVESEASVTVNSATGFAIGKLILFTFDNPTWVAADAQAASYKFLTRIVDVAGSVITLQDALPHAIQSGWTHSVQAWTPAVRPRIQMEADLSAQGQKKTVTAISKANPAVLTVPAHGYTNGDTISLNGPISGMVEIHGATAAITVINSNSFSIPVNSTAFSTYTGGAFVRQSGVCLRLACVDSPDIDLLAYDNDGAGSALQIDLCYNPKIVARLRNCGNENNADLQTYCWTGGEIVSMSDDPSGFGVTTLGGHYGTYRLLGSSRAETGRGFKTGKTKYCTYYGGAINNPAFTALSLTWVTQDCDFYGFTAIGSRRSAIQPVGAWTSQCYNTGNRIFGLDAKGSTSLDVQINSTDSVELIASKIGNLDVPAGGSVTLTGGDAPATITGTGTVTRTQGSKVLVRATTDNAVDTYADNFYYNKITANAATNGQGGWEAVAKDSGGVARSVLWLNAAGENYQNVATGFGHSWRVNGVRVGYMRVAPVAQGMGLTLDQAAASTTYANDAAAAAGGVPLNGFYRNGSVVQVRVV